MTKTLSMIQTVLKSIQSIFDVLENLTVYAVYSNNSSKSNKSTKSVQYFSRLWQTTEATNKTWRISSHKTELLFLRLNVPKRFLWFMILINNKKAQKPHISFTSFIGFLTPYTLFCALAVLINSLIVHPAPSNKFS